MSLQTHFSNSKLVNSFYLVLLPGGGRGFVPLRVKTNNLISPFCLLNRFQVWTAMHNSIKSLQCFSSFFSFNRLLTVSRAESWIYFHPSPVCVTTTWKLANAQTSKSLCLPPFTLNWADPFKTFSKQICLSFFSAALATLRSSSTCVIFFAAEEEISAQMIGIESTVNVFTPDNVMRRRRVELWVFCSIEYLHCNLQQNFSTVCSSLAQEWRRWCWFSGWWYDARARANHTA